MLASPGPVLNSAEFHVTVLDASALLTCFFGEPGAGVVRQRLPGSVMHTVNDAEVLSKLAGRGLPPEVAE